MYRSCIAAQSITAHVCKGSQSKVKFGKFLARRKPVQLYCGAAGSADKGSSIRVLDPEIDASHVRSSRHPALFKKSVLTKCIHFLGSHYMAEQE